MHLPDSHCIECQRRYHKPRIIIPCFIMTAEISEIAFPISLHNEWATKTLLSESHTASLTEPLTDWLFNTGSLTERLKKQSQVFYVELLGQHEIMLSKEMQQKLGCTDEFAWLREVVLRCDDVPMVYAQSIMPKSSVTGEQERLAHLGHQPLGEVLFSDPSMTRNTIEVARFDSKSDVINLAQMLGQSTQIALWGRRSVFTVNDKPILVSEVFLPKAACY